MAIQSSWLILSLALLVLGAPFTAGAETKTDEQEALYAIGIRIGASIETLMLSEEEFDLVTRGIRDKAMEGEVRDEPEEIKKKVRTLMDDRLVLWKERQKKSNEKIISNAAKEKGAVRTKSGLVYLELSAGTGAFPAPLQKVEVHYHGTLSDGTVFDSSVERGRTSSFALNRVIPCWTEALQKMRVGGKAKITCPPELAYGDKKKAAIPPGSVLIFEVELIATVE